MQALPPAQVYDGVRDSIAMQINELKHSLIHAKPIGARVDACRALVTRCQARKEQAQQALNLAQQVMADADKELADANAEMVRLESELASSEKPDSLESMATSMTRVLTEMQDGGIVPPKIIEEAQNQMQVLLGGIRKIAES
eukprot:5033889-Karenia_brevis.AAC.1